MANRYFSYNGDAYQTHETAEDAQREAFKALDYWREEAIADGEWSEEASTIAWGEIREHACPETTASEDGENMARCEYMLTPNTALNAALDLDAKRHEAVVEALIAAGADVDLEAIAVSADPWGDVIDLIASLGGGR